MADLKPCPFCGCFRPLNTFVRESAIQFFHCDERLGGCGAVVLFSPRKIGKEAFEAWNRRPVEPASDNELPGMWSQSYFTGGKFGGSA